MNLKIVTDAAPPDMQPAVEFNGERLQLGELRGGIGPGEILEATLLPSRFAHSVLLVNPDDGIWSIRELAIRYVTGDEQAYDVSFGSIDVPGCSNLDIWRDPPGPVYVL